jgi:A/G-specific adenine glycosylase
MPSALRRPPGRAGRTGLAPARVAALRRRLLGWWDAGHRALPWRFPQGRADPYAVWLAEVMLQQTRVEAVVPYYRRFLARWPTLEALAGADEEELLAAWSGLGYYARCRNLLAAARESIGRHGGLPRTPEELRALPGFGPYTAGAVASIAFGVPVPAIDGNAARVLARLLGVAGESAARAVGARAGALASALVSPGRPGDLNQALMDLGATVCLPRSPACARCPLSDVCAARRTGRARAIPAPRRRASPRRMEMAVARAERDGRVLVARRAGRGLFGGLWEMPSAEVGRGESPSAALRRVLRRDLGAVSRVGEVLAVVERLLTHRRLVLAVHRCVVRGEVRVVPGGRYLDVRWAAPAELDGLGVSTAMRRAAEAGAAGARRAVPGAERDPVPAGGRDPGKGLEGRPRHGP